MDYRLKPRLAGPVLAAAALALAAGGLSACEQRSEVRPVATVTPAAPAPQTPAPAAPTVTAPSALPPGFAAEVVGQGFQAPAGMAFDGQGRLYVLESGGEASPPRLLRLTEGGGAESVAVSEPGARWHGLAHHGNSFYVVQTSPAGAALLRLPADGGVPSLVFEPDAPGAALRGPVAGPDGALYVHVRAKGDCLAVIAGEEVADPAPSCNAIARIAPDGAPDVVAMDSFNPLAMAFGPDKTLYVMEHPADGQPGDGARTAPLPPVVDGEARALGLRPLRILELPGGAGFDFATAGVFGEPETAFIADAEAGRVLMMDVANGTVRVFANEFLGLERPVTVRFAPSGQALYVLDAGAGDAPAAVWRIGADGA